MIVALPSFENAMCSDFYLVFMWIRNWQFAQAAVAVTMLSNIFWRSRGTVFKGAT
jgi:hypothetical protein